MKIPLFFEFTVNQGDCQGGKTKGVTLEDYVDLGVYTWTQPSYSDCLHMDPAHLGNLH